MHKTVDSEHEHASKPLFYMPPIFANTANSDNKVLLCLHQNLPKHFPKMFFSLPFQPFNFTDNFPRFHKPFVWCGQGLLPPLGSLFGKTWAVASIYGIYLPLHIPAIWPSKGSTKWSQVRSMLAIQPLSVIAVTLS